MKRLFKKSKHDVQNRDTAIVYINGEFYEDLTHALCLKQFVEKTNYDEEINSLQFRPSIDIFTDISKRVGPVVLGHRVDKEEAIYLIYTVIDENIIGFNKIPSNIINDFKSHYNLDVKDEMEHSDDAENKYNEQEQWDRAFDRVNDIGGKTKLIEDLRSLGFNKKNNNAFINNYSWVVPGDPSSGTDARVCVIGNKKQEMENKDVIQYINSADMSLYNKVTELNGIIMENFPNFIIVLFNNNGDDLIFVYNSSSNKLSFENDIEYNKEEIDELKNENIDFKNINFNDLDKFINLSHV